jgi:hypothetical protein
MPNLLIKVGGIEVGADWIASAPQQPGTCWVTVTLPETLASGDAVPVTLDLIGSNGQVYSSNTPTIAVGQRF